jgi:hypothetical protein
MSTPTPIGELVAAVVRAAGMRREAPREQRLQLGAATLLAFLVHVHGDEAEDILLAASEAYVSRRTNAHHIASIGLDALAEVGRALDNDCDATRVALYNPRSTIADIRKTLDVAAWLLQPREQRDTLPPYEERDPHGCSHLRDFDDAQCILTKGHNCGHVYP